MFQYASYLKVRPLSMPLRPRSDVLVLAGGTGRLTHEKTLHMYEWVAREFTYVYTLMHPDDVPRAESMLPPNVYPLNLELYSMGRTRRVITGNRSNAMYVNILVLNGYARHQSVDYAAVNIFQKGVEHTGKNGVVCLANDARHPAFDAGRVYMQ
jgi:hypothetical protein